MGSSVLNLIDSHVDMHFWEHSDKLLSHCGVQAHGGGATRWTACTNPSTIATDDH